MRIPIFTTYAVALPHALLWILLAGPVWLLSRIPYHRLSSSLSTLTFVESPHRLRVKTPSAQTRALPSVPARQDVAVNIDRQEVRLPSIVIQVGTPRTATTTQFQHACVAMHLAHETQGKPGHCLFLERENYSQGIFLNYIRDFFNESTRTSTDSWQVLKTHLPVSEVTESISSLPRQWRQNVWVLTTTARSDAAPRRGKGRRRSRKSTARSNSTDSDFFTYVRTVGDLTRKGVFNLTTEYANMFGLSPEQVDSFHQYMDRWAILRQCCGTQMSSHWRDFLQGRSNSYPPCEQQNITEVELALMGSSVYRTFGGREFYIQALSINDHVFTGHYCEAVAHYIMNQTMDVWNTDLTHIFSKH